MRAGWENTYRPIVHFSADMFCSKLQSNSHSYRLTYSHRQNESYFVRHFCWKRSLRVKNAECSCRSISVHYARRESPFHAAISRVIYHWADIMASRCSHIGITEAVAWPANWRRGKTVADWVACRRPLCDWGVNPLYYYPTGAPCP